MNSSEDLNNSPVHWAASKNDTKTVKHLFENRADINATNSFGWTPLMQASRNGHLETVKLLLELGADIKHKNEYDMTATMLACVNASAEVVKTLLDAEASAAKEIEDIHYQFSSLMISSLSANDDVVRLLLDKDYNANASSLEIGISPLMFAASCGQTSTVDILLDRGAKKDVTNKAHLSASDIAIACEHFLLGQKLKFVSLKQRTKGQEFNDVMQTIKENNLSLLKDILFNDSTKAETENLEGMTPLMLAAMLGYISISELLLFYGANINSQDVKNGFTPLMLAIYYRQTGTTKFLMEKGADLNIANEKGYTAFDLANETMDYEILRMFAESQINFMTIPNRPTTNSSSTNVQYHMKQFWNKLSPRSITDSNTQPLKKKSDIPRGLTSYDPYVPVSFETLDPDIPAPVNRSDPIEFFANLTKPMDIKPFTPPPPLKKGIPELSSLDDKSNTFTYENLIRKMKRVEVDKQNAMRNGLGNQNLLTGKLSEMKINVNNFEIVSTKGDVKELQNLNDTMKGATKSVGINTLAMILTKLNLRQYDENFKQQGIDLETFLMLTPRNLNELGISDVAKIGQVMEMISNLNKML